MNARAERREKVLHALKAWRSRFPYFNPSVRDLCAATGINSTSQVAQALDELEKSKVIHQRVTGKSRRKSRTIALRAGVR